MLLIICRSTSVVYSIIITCFHAELAGPLLCRAFIQTTPINCWDGRRRRLADITRFTVDGIAGQGIYCSPFSAVHGAFEYRTHCMGPEVFVPCIKNLSSSQMFKNY